MKQYFFIPITFDTMLSQIVNDWLQQPESYIILTGVYKPTDDNITEDFTETYTKNNLGEIINFKKGFVSEDEQNMEIVGFCLEGSLEIVAPDLLEEINKYPEILQFETNTEYLEWIKNI